MGGQLEIGSFNAMKACTRPGARGVTLVEAVLFISVALGLIVGGLQFYQQSVSAVRTQELIRLTNAIVTEARIIYGSDTAPTRGAECSEQLSPDTCEGFSPEFLDLLNVTQAASADEVLIASGSIPSGSLRADGATTLIVTPWGAPLNAWVARNDGTSNLIVRLTGVPIEICTRIAPVTAQGRSLLGDQVNFVFARGEESRSPPISPANAAELCGGGDDLDLSIGFRLS
jgi:hypothetical protein